MPSLRRFFQPQIPQLFRPTIASVLAKTVGRVNLDGPADGLTAVAYWARFSRWCRNHQVPESPDGRNGTSRTWLYQSVIKQQRLTESPVLYLEFGVYRGESMRFWVESITHKDSRFVGFDTFTGLPEHWRFTEPAGHFNAHSKTPDISDPRCSFAAGLFQETLPQFVRQKDLSGRLVVNMDADMFTSTLFVLTTLASFLKHGDIIFFDEFSCPLDEFRAFESFVRSFRIKYEVVGAVYGYTRVCIRIE